MAGYTAAGNIGTGGEAAAPVAPAAPPARVGRSLRWYASFLAFAIAAFLLVGHYTGVDVIAGTARFAWNAAVIAANSALRAASSLLSLVAKGIGWRRLSRLSTALLSIGTGYSGSLLLSDRGLQRARGWSGKLRRLASILRQKWIALHLVWKLVIVAALVASQLYLHFLLILFPIAFLVPVVRRLWVRSADLLLGNWYWRTFGGTHRALVRLLRGLPPVRRAVGAARLLRMRYLTAWRLWKYHPRYRCPQTNRRRVSLGEPVRLWWRGELDGYVGKPLFAGTLENGAGRDA